MRNSEDTNNRSVPQNGFAPLLFEVVSALVSCLMVVALLFTFVCRMVVVDGSSMNPTLYDRDRLITIQPVYSPDYGDIVIISRMFTQEEPIVKRVIGLAGDEISLDYDRHCVILNGEVMEEYGDFEPIMREGDIRFPITVPENCIFVLGDNRNHSLDSRFAEIGCIPADRVLGKAAVRIYPVSEFRVLK